MPTTAQNGSEAVFPDGEGRIWTLLSSRTPHSLADESHPLLAPASYTLYEWTDYWVRYDGADRLRVGDTFVDPVDVGLFRLRYENQLGLTYVQPFRHGLPCCPPLALEVLSPKFPTISEHLLFLGNLLDDLFARAARLPFTISASTTRGVSDAPAPPTPLFTFHFLLQHASELRDAWNTIHGRPHRTLTDHPQIVPISEASEADPDVMLSVLMNPDRWVKARNIPLAHRLRGHAPTDVWQRRPEESLDTPENRFVLAFLRSVLAAAQRLPSERWWSSVSVERQQAIMEVQAILRRALESPLFAEVGDMHRIPASSRILMRREGYRQMLHLWRLFNMASRPFFGALQRAIDVRDIATLYEMWAFFALVEEIQVALDITPELDLDISDDSGLGRNSRARFGTAGTLVYNQSRKGYSVTFRPDFLWLRNSKPEVALDAKFRMDRRAFSDPEDESPESAVQVSDLYKMHTYRDALGLQAAVVVYPGDSDCFYHTTASADDGHSLTAILTGSAHGVGALPLIPDQSQA